MYRLTILSILVAAVLSGSCHYSCHTCQSANYQFCLTCASGQPIAPVADSSSNTNPNYTGVCTDIAPAGVNVLGIILLISGCLGLVLTKSSKLFFILYSLQSIGLFSLVSVAWVPSASYLLRSLQYLMPCNLITASSKEGNQTLQRESYYKLDQYFRRSDLESSMTLLGALNFFAFAWIVFLLASRLVRKNFCSYTSCRFALLSEWAISMQINFLTSLFFFMIQETALCLMVAFQFDRPASAYLITFTILYFFIFVFFLVLVFKLKIPFFTNRFLQYHNIGKRVIYPIFLIVDFDQQFFIFVFMMFNVVLEILFDWKNNEYPRKSTMTIYKGLETACILLSLIYYFVETGQNSLQSSTVAGSFLTVFLAAFIITVFVQIGLKAYKNCTQPNKSNAVSNTSSRNKSTRSKGNKQVSGRMEATQSDIVEQRMSEQVLNQFGQDDNQEALQANKQGNVQGRESQKRQRKVKKDKSVKLKPIKQVKKVKEAEELKEAQEVKEVEEVSEVNEANKPEEGKDKAGQINEQ